MTPKTFDDLKTEVIDPGLCTRCGSCVGVCKEQVIRFSDPLGVCLPGQTGLCDTCDGVCYEACSGKEVLWPVLNQQVFGRQPESYLLGNYQHVYVGFATDSVVRSNAASGGIISAVSLYLLESGLVDGVVTLVDDEAKPYRAVPRIVTDRTGVLAAAQSKYCISPINTIFHELADRPGIYAYVGLPCEVHSLRKLQQMGHPAAVKIKYVIGSYCGNILHFDAVRSYLARNGINDLSQVASLKYRAGEWPGKLEVRLYDGRVFSLEKFYANYLIPFYIMQRCLLCTDLTNEFSDISVGDGWAPAYEERGKGWSIVLARTSLGADLLRVMKAKGLVQLYPITEEAAVNMHSHGLDLKKRGAFLRIQSRRSRRLPVPEYGYVLGDVPLRRRLQETITDLILWLCSLEVSRRVINAVPIELVGRVFKTARRFWIRSTKSTKRKGLIQTEFHVTESR